MCVKFMFTILRSEYNYKSILGVTNVEFTIPYPIFYRAHPLNQN